MPSFFKQRQTKAANRTNATFYRDKPLPTDIQTCLLNRIPLFFQRIDTQKHTSAVDFYDVFKTPKFFTAFSVMAKVNFKAIKFKNRE